MLKDIKREEVKDIGIAVVKESNVDNDWKVFLNGGRIATELDAFEWAKRGVELGAGEINCYIIYSCMCMIYESYSIILFMKYAN